MKHHGKHPLFHFDLDFGVIVSQNVAQYPPNNVMHAPVKIEATTSNGLGDTLIRKFIIWPLTLALRSHIILPSALYMMWPIHLQSFKLQCAMV